jgi:mRNA interferase MazF
VIGRGAVVWTDLGVIDGSAPAKRRPVVVVQSNSFNRSGLQTTIVLSLSSNTLLAEYPGNVFIPRSASGLASDSVVLPTQMTTVDQSELGGVISTMPTYLMAEVDAGMRLVLGL